MARPTVDPNQSFPALEQEIIERWRERDVFRESVRRREGAPTYTFYEGPPTANGRPGSHHVLARVFKDIYPRYKTMRGFKAERKGGWDCHGLPVEIAVERELGLHDKHDIERYGIAEFNARCRASVDTYLEEWDRLTERIGYWVDLDDAYRTMDASYVESVWWALKEIHAKGLLYQGHKVVPYCPRCGTALSSHEVAQGYKDVVDPSVYVRFPVTDVAGAPLEAGDELVVWTTTPWTLVSNAAVAVAPELDYVRVRAADGHVVVLAAALVERVVGEGSEELARFPGSALEGVRYEPPFAYIAGSEYGPLGHSVLLGDFVTADDGTGLVHTAIAFGEDDYRLGTEAGLTVVNPVALDGTYDERIGAYAGRFVKDADRDLIEDLRARAASSCASRSSSTHTRTAGAAGRRSSTTPSPPGTSGPRASARSSSPPTRPSTGTRSTSSTAASASGWRATSTGRSPGSATGARRCPSGARRTARRSSWWARWPSSRSSRA